VLVYDLHRDLVPLPGAENVSATRTQDSISLSLGEARLVVQSSGARVVYDFAGARVLRIDEATRTYRDDSLYSIAGFRLQEWRHLALLMQAVAAGGGEIDAGLRAVDRTTFFGLAPAGEDGGAEPKVSNTDAGLTFRHGDEVVSQFEPSTVQLAAPQLRAWRRFLAYECHLHPAVRQRIVDVSAAPAGLETLVRFGPVSLATTMTLAGRSAEEPAIGVPDGFTLGIRDGPPWRRHQVAAARPIDAPEERLASDRGPYDYDGIEKGRDVARVLEAGRHLEAFLLAHLHYLQFGHPEILHAVLPHVERDRGVRKLRKYMEPKAQKDARRALQLFRRLRKKAGSATLLLDIYAANLHEMLGDSEQAEALFLAALAKNPRLAGVWHDLGLTYFKRFCMGEAWQCWDAGRRACPRHPMFEEQDDREKQLREEYPDFF
jgi:hypothetical protein